MSTTAAPPVHAPDHALVPPATPAQAACYQRLRGHLADLKLSAAATALPALLDAAREENLSVLEALERLLGLQASASAARRADNNLRFASLPAPWSLEDYGFLQAGLG